MGHTLGSQIHGLINSNGLEPYSPLEFSETKKVKLGSSAENQTRTSSGKVLIFWKCLFLPMYTLYSSRTL